MRLLIDRSLSKNYDQDYADKIGSLIDQLPLGDLVKYVKGLLISHDLA